MDHRDEGFTLVEIMAVVLIMATLFMIAIPLYTQVTARAASAACLANRTTVDKAASVYVSSLSTSPVNVNAMVDAGYLKAAPRCPSGGVYVFSSARAGGNDTLTCSIHP
jgi:general secretion pathway protein G